MKPLLKIKNFLLLLILPFSQLVHAQVNMMDGSFHTTSVDLEFQQDHQLFQLRRTYSSRSLHDGLFGFGWCSDFEKRIDLRRSDQLTLIDCRLPAEVVFKKKRGIYQSLQDPDDHLEISSTQYVLKNKHRLLTFNLRGQLTSLSDTSGSQVKIFYDPRQALQKLQFGSSSQIKFRLDSGRRRILSILGPKSLSATYEYEKNHLIASTSSRQTTQYRYDALHNLIEIRSGEKAHDLIKYDAQKDWVQQISDHEGCNLTYKFTPGQTAQEFTSTSEKTCRGSLPEKITFHFTFSTDPEGHTFLEKVTRTTNNKKFERLSFQAPQ
jgi:YD repeat-containing protein